MTMKQHGRQQRSLQLKGAILKRLNTTELNMKLKFMINFFKKRLSRFPCNSCSTVLQLLEGNPLKRFLKKYKTCNITFMLICSRKRGTSSQAKR